MSLHLSLPIKTIPKSHGSWLYKTRHFPSCRLFSVSVYHLNNQSVNNNNITTASSSSQNHEPLKIAFCGSDNFSIYSFKALLKYASENPSHINSIDLITRLPKASGRGRKNITSTPILDQLPTLLSQLPSPPTILTHTPESKDEFLQLQNERNYDLVIAVSYGKLIPQKFLSLIRFGGLNVHPSLLPKYSGASPLHYALLNRDPYTGVTVQTLHPTKFDKGDILLQSPELPLPQLLSAQPLPFSSLAELPKVSKSEATNAILSQNVSSPPLTVLTNALGRIGADLLLNVIKNRYYISPDTHKITPKYQYSYAPRIPSSAQEILLNSTDAKTILVNNKVLGPLYIFQDTLPVTKKKKKSGNETNEAANMVQKRVQLDNIIDVSNSFPKEYPEIAASMNVGDYHLINTTDKSNESSSALVLKTKEYDQDDTSLPPGTHGYVAAHVIKTENYAACSAYQLKLSMKKRGIFKNLFCCR